jgi:hypothetical protein
VERNDEGHDERDGRHGGGDEKGAAPAGKAAVRRGRRHG